MKNLILGLLLITCSQVQAQTSVNYNTSPGVATLQTTLFNNESVQGSVYLFENWDNSARIYSDGGGIIDIENINFNVQNAKFSSKIAKDSIFTFYKIYKVEVNGKHFERVNNKIYEVLYTFDDKSMFLKEYSVKVEPELHIITSTVIGPGKYVIEDKFYIFKNNKLDKFWLSKKNTLKMLSSQKQLILKHSKNNKLSYSKENDIVEIFKYYDSL